MPESAQPIEVQQPQAGGSYTVDPLTGQLTRNPAEAAPEALPEATPTDTQE